MLKKYYLGGFFLAPIPVKRYQNTSGFAGADFTDCMSFLPSNLMEEVNTNAEALTQIPNSFHQYEIAEKTKII